MSITLLPYGNVIVFLLALAILVACAVLVNQVALFVGRVALSLDVEGAPKVLETNWLLSLIKKYIKPVPSSWYVKKDDEYLDRNDNAFCFRQYNSTFGIKSEAVYTAKKFDRAEVVTKEMSYAPLFGSVFLYVSLADAAILWLQIHFSSAVWCLSMIGIVLTLRFITSKIWGHNKRITTLEDKNEG
jgi:hypothetical protein